MKIQHHSGKVHKNADGLSRRPCAEFECKYCSRIEKKEVREREKRVARIVLKKDLTMIAEGAVGESGNFFNFAGKRV